MATLNFTPAPSTQVKASPRVWAQNQLDIFNFATCGTGNAIVEAVAGSGKTTTIVEVDARITGTSVFLAFGKAIAEEMKSRGVNASTFHSLTYRIVTEFFGVKTVTMDKLDKIMASQFKKDRAWIYGAFAKRLVGLARQTGIGCLVPDTISEWEDLVDLHNLELESEEGTISKGIEFATELLAHSNKSNMVDFDDLLYMPVLHNLRLNKYDFILVDEAQDTNAIQRALIKKLMHGSSRLIAVGDEAQAIYGFRGSDSNSLKLIEKEFNCIRLPLDVTYRCPKKVVEYANQWVPNIKAAANATEGEVKNLNEWDLKIFNPEDLIVCRTTKPLVSLAFKLLSARIPAIVLGREIGQGLKNLVWKIIKSYKVSDILELRVALHKWLREQVIIAEKTSQPHKIEGFTDKVEAIEGIIEGLEETGSKGLKDLENAIDYLFKEKASAITLCTIHKAKGLEAGRVFWLNKSACPSKWAKMDWQKQQEENLCYVAATRAKKELIIIETDNLNDSKKEVAKEIKEVLHHELKDLHFNNFIDGDL